MSMSDAGKIAELKAYFERRADVALAFLFGSRAEGRARSKSDWDIGVYFTPQTPLEWEAEREFPAEHEVSRDVGDIVPNEVEIVVLNQAPAALAYRILGSGLPLSIKDRGLYLDLLNRLSYEAIDFHDFAWDYWQVFQRSASLNPGDRSRLVKIITFIQSETADFPRFQLLAMKDYLENRSVKREVERWIENLVNAALDCAKIILASQKRPLPESYKKIMQALGTTDYFNQVSVERFAHWTELRNILAHEYLDIRWPHIERFIKEGQRDFEAFGAGVKRALNE